MPPFQGLKESNCPPNALRWAIECRSFRAKLSLDVYSKLNLKEECGQFFYPRENLFCNGEEIDGKSLA